MKRFVFLLLIIIPIIIINCKNNSGMEDKDIKSKISRGEKVDFIRKKCNLSFEKFFRRFKRDSLFQKQRIYNFGELIVIDNYEGTVEKKKLGNTFLDLESEEQVNIRKTDGYKINIKKYKDSVVYTKLGIDNGIFVNFIFKKIDNCWYLVRIIDGSD